MADIALLAVESDSAHSRRVFFARHLGKPFEPVTATLALIQGVWAVDPKFARKILRSRIFASEAMTPLAEGVVRVSAKRWNPGTPVAELEGMIDEARAGESQLIDVTEDARRARDGAKINLSPALPGQGSDWMLSLQAHLNTIGQTENAEIPRYEKSRAVAAVLVTGETAWAMALNQNVTNRTLHAEMILIQNWWRIQQCPLPRNTKLYVTLQCCRMCAAAILHATENPSDIEVIYGEEDPGPMAKNTQLQTYGRERKH